MTPELARIVTSLIFTSISSAAMGAFVLYKNRSKISITWFLTSLSVAGWSLFISISMTSHEYTRALLFARIANAISAFIPTFFIHFCLHVTKSKNSIPVYLAYLNSIIVLLFSGSIFFLDVIPKHPFFYYSEPKYVYHLFTIHFFSFAIYAEIMLLRKIFSDTREPLKNQIKYIFIGTSLGFISGFNYFLPIYNLPMMPVLPYFVWSYAAIITYAIVRHQLLEITVVFRKGLIYSLLVAVTSSIYFVLVYLAGHFFQNYTGYKSLPQVLIVLAVVALAFKPIERWAQEFVDKILLKKTTKQLERENELLRLEVQKQDKMKAVATLAAGMAHEIKNPLTVIKTFTDHLPEKIEDPNFVSRFHSIVSSEVSKIDEIVKGLLDFSKPTPLRLERIDLRVLINDLIGLLNEQLIRANIETVKKYSGALTVQADKKQLNQALLNLFLNSLESMRMGGCITVDCKAKEAHCEISITDSGLGIKKENLTRVFDPFYTTKETGTGLGLSVVHQIIEQHGGTVQILSEEGKGTTAKIIIPKRL